MKEATIHFLTTTVRSRSTQASMLGQLERFLKQAIVDKNPFVMSSALVAAIHLFRIGK